MKVKLLKKLRKKIRIEERRGKFRARLWYKGDSGDYFYYTDFCYRTEERAREAQRQYLLWYMHEKYMKSVWRSIFIFKTKIASFILNCFQYRSLVVSVGILTLIRMYVDNAVIRVTMLIAAMALIVSVSINIFLWLRSKVNN
jgi:hypothetical protein